MSPSPTYNFPWELISSSFSGGLSKEEELQLQQWLASDPDHKEKYQKLQEIWNNSLEDYKLYLMANEAKAWDALQVKLTDKKEIKVLNLKPGKTHRVIYRVAAVAVIILLIGVGYWYTSSRSRTMNYETSANEQKNVKLTDGSTIALNAATKIEVSQHFNKKNRTVIMSSGEASFDIQHRNDLPFIVDLGKVNVKDIGTVFKIKKDKEQIKVTVISGTVVFSKLSTNETRELTAGMSLIYNILNDSFDEIQTDNPAPKGNNIVLNFDNTPLKDVISMVQKKFGKTIRLEGPGIDEQKITAQLDGVSFNTALDIICESLSLEYTLKDDIYVLRKKNDR
jgi:Fe2+-dicitrate sensor, membrane component